VIDELFEQELDNLAHDLTNLAIASRF